MYRIKIDDAELSRLTQNYLARYKLKLRDEIQGFLDGEKDFIFKRSVGGKFKKYYTFRVSSNPMSFTCAFLKECTDPNNTLLDDLLTGDVNKQMAIINRVFQNDPGHFEKFTAKKAKQLGYTEDRDVDDFNTIMDEIFVKRSFEGEHPVHALALGKDDFVKELGIRICPYCGRAYIFRVEKKGKGKNVPVKPQLDHFLPKSDYPFLGMNFFNLIPCCAQCNMAPCKVDNDPLDNDRSQIVHLMHPYDFDEKRVRFMYQIESPNTYTPDSFSVMVGYDSKELKKGYNGFLALDKLYECHNVEVYNMFLRARAFRAAANGLYSGLGLGGAQSTLPAQAVLGFSLNGKEERRQLMYKFKKDTFLQMMGLDRRLSLSISLYVDRDGKEVVVKTGNL